ncbi:MAG: methylthioribulose 1-phosphate dehydratase [Acidobacteriota bacterium]
MDHSESLDSGAEVLPPPPFSRLAGEISRMGRDFHRHGWLPGTGGNLSAVCRRDPLEMAVTRSGADKGRLRPADIVRVGERGERLAGAGRPSAEVLLHLAVARRRGAGAVLHTHSVFGTLASQARAREGGVHLEGFEMLKGLAGVGSHDHREWLPIMDNSQDAAALSRQVEETLDRQPEIHGFLLFRHGLYTWGADLEEARRHVEVLEFLLEVVVRCGPGTA